VSSTESAENHQRTADVGLADEHRRVRAIDERRHPFGLRRLQRRAHPRDVFGQPDSGCDDVAERDERRTIARPQAIEHAAAGGLQVAQPQTLEARAHVEREHHVERNLFEAGEIDRLPDAVVEHLEVGGRQPLQRLAVAGDEHVHAHGLQAALEDRLRAGRRDGQHCRAHRRQRTS
jgi:hypothetical protein